MAVAALRGDFNGGALEVGAGHLARDRALPDQLIKPRLLGTETFELIGLPPEIRRPDRLVRLLGVLGLRLVHARRLRHVALAELCLDLAARRRDCLGYDLHAVRSHISNEAHGLAADVDAFIEALGDLHGLTRGEAQACATPPVAATRW